ncbi:MAG: ABC transporter ATP-binding protein [Desulfamplus sp.]|nr:ABC transporter ATP-binding protein [Desulfamplus sp.]
MKGGLGGYQELEEELNKQRDFKLLKRFIPLIRQNRRVILLSIALMIMLSIADIAVPFITRTAVDDYILPGMAKGTTQSDKAQYLFNAAMSGLTLFILSIVIFVLNFFQNFVMEYAGQLMMHDLRLEIFSRIQNQPVSYFSKNTVGRLSTRVTNDVQNMQELFTSIITFVIKDAFLLISILFVLVGMDIKLSLIMFIIIPFVVLSTWAFSAKSREIYRRLRSNIAEINSMFSECIGGIKVIQLFTQQKKVIRDFKRLNHENYLAGMDQIKVFGIFMPIIDLLSSIALAAVIFYGGGRVASDNLTLGTLVAFISYTKMFFRPVRDLSEKHNILQNALASGERLIQILDTDEENRGGTKTLETIDSLEFQNVSFKYEIGANGSDSEVIKNVSFTVNRGESLAILGPTGSGKTSLMNLIVRFYQHGSGDILINGKEIESYSTYAIRSKVAIVTQDPYLFSGTIRENITPPDRSFTDEQLNEILELSYLKSIVDHLSNGVNTLISEGGASLSSGERQLISIARAFAHQPDLIIFDEATSYVDTESEEKIRIATAKLRENRTSITIAHRLRSAMTADKIIVLKDGKVIESGNHDMLMNLKGFYFKLHSVK